MIKEFCSDFGNFSFFLTKLKSERNFSNIGTKNTDHIWELTELGNFYGYCFKSYILKYRLTTECHK